MYNVSPLMISAGLGKLKCINKDLVINNGATYRET